MSISFYQYESQMKKSLSLDASYHLADTLISKFWASTKVGQGIFWYPKRRIRVNSSYTCSLNACMEHGPLQHVSAYNKVSWHRHISVNSSQWGYLQEGYPFWASRNPRAWLRGRTDPSLSSGKMNVLRRTEALICIVFTAGEMISFNTCVCVGLRD